MDKFSDLLHELGLHYNHYVSPSVRGHLAKMLMTLDPHVVYFDHILHAYTCQDSLTTGMQKHLLMDEGLLSISPACKILLSLEPYGIFRSNSAHIFILILSSHRYAKR